MSKKKKTTKRRTLEPALLEAVGAELGLGRREATQAVEAVVAWTVRRLLAGERVEFPGLGTLQPLVYAQTGRSPLTGAALPLPLGANVTAGVRLDAGLASALAAAHPAGLLPDLADD